STQTPDDVAVTRQLAASMMQIENFSEAESAYARILAKTPSEPDSWYALGVCQIAQNKREAAVAPWKRVVSLDRDHAKAHAALAEAYIQSGDYDRAWLSVRETQRVGGYIDPKLVGRLQELSGRTGPE